MAETLEEMKELLRSMKRSEIKLLLEDVNEKVALGKSHFGGVPDVPDHFTWPLNKTRNPCSF